MRRDDQARELRDAIDHAIRAHARHSKSPRGAVRFSDGKTPYAIHPIWCAMTLLTETTLPEDLRRAGYLALLWHDVLEDTTLPLPEEAPPEVVSLVQELTFHSFDEEVTAIWERSDTAKLLKLYDKVSNLLDAAWMSDRKWDRYVAYTRRLAEFAERRYGALNIVRIAGAVCRPCAERGARRRA